MKLDCTTDRYDEIYAPYLTKADELLVLGRYKSSDRLLDLCGGTGAVTRAAVEMARAETGNDGLDFRELPIVLLDRNPRYRSRHVGSELSGVYEIRNSAENLGSWFGPKFDIVICRQAIGYVDPTIVIPAVAHVLAPGGRFCFNMFRKPSRWGFRRKQFRGVDFIEIHARLFRHVWHAQIRRERTLPRNSGSNHPLMELIDAAIPVYEPGGLDISHFRYHPTEWLLELLAPHFEVQITQKPNGRGLHWLCVKKEAP